MYHWIHHLLVAIYLALPAAALVWTLVRARRTRETTPLVRLGMTFLAAALLGTALAYVFAAAVNGAMSIPQALLASYFAAGMLLLLKGVEAGLRWGFDRLLRIRPPVTDPAASTPPAKNRGRRQLAYAGRVVVLVVLGLPYIMAAVMTYRPKVNLTDNPRTQLGVPYEDVSFESTDGVTLSGWWIPASPRPRSANLRDAHEWGRRTVVVCHGLGANKANQLAMSRALLPFGYNVLIFDFRAHGQSGGQLSSFGDLERRDVLGAVRWLQQHRAEEAEQIFGVGASMGAAALIAAAADRSPEGQAIEAVAVYGTYPSLGELTRSITRDNFIRPMGWLAAKLGLPLASAQVGSDLNAFAPAELVNDVWPRPVLIIHGTQDEIIPFSQGLQLFHATSQPKQRLWLSGADHNGVINDDTAARRVRQFFNDAKPVPVI